MAATASPRSDRLARFLAEASGARTVEIGEMALLEGGAIQQNWGFDASFDGAPQRLVLRTDSPTGVPASLSRPQEFEVLRAVFAAGVAVPEPLYVCPDPAAIGRPFFVMRRLPGHAIGRVITRDPALDPILPDLAARLGTEIARMQRVRGLDFLPPDRGPEGQIAAFRAYLDTRQPRPVLEWGLRWLETHLPDPLPPVLCHRDFRTGNYLVDGTELSGILDWEFAGWGDPDEDLAWFCCKGWRFARLDREAGGIADREHLYRGYEAESGRRIDPERLRFWEIVANIRWAVVALQQSDRYILGGEQSLARAITGRRATECEFELLWLLDPDARPG
ncbi:MAG TPA: phosphotransferase family protein [Stellaceae bacterium]|nr:phosphotransferase family protein [Stellaceae bacterium]